jgi:hypothetical protein
MMGEHNHHVNHPIYATDEYLGYCILIVSEEYKEVLTHTDPLVSSTNEINDIWKMFFDGTYSKEGMGVSVVLILPNKK